MGIFDNIASGVALVVSLLAIVTFLIARRRVGIDEGRHLEAVRRLGEDLNEAQRKVHALETASHERDLATTEIKTDVKHVIETTERIEAKLDRHINGGPK